MKLDRYGGWRGCRSRATGFFRVERLDGRWWFVTPEGNAFLSVGVNHVDYREDYTAEFVGFVCSCLRDWGFNTVGWSQESLSPKFVKGQVVHSRGWGPAQYEHVTMPYAHLLRFTDIEWYQDERYPDVFDDAFAEKCDRVARAFCAKMSDDPNLVGYFYSDTPNWPKWAAVTGHDLRKKLDRRHFQELASRYYRVIHDAIRRYDRNHLLLGDRFKGNAMIQVDGDGVDGLPDCVLDAMQDTVDVLSIEYFAHFESMRADLDRWHRLSGKPVLLADSAFLAPTDALNISPGAKVYVSDQAARGRAYREFARQAFSLPWIVGWHWCAFGRSVGRRSGLLDGKDRPYEACVSEMRAFNRKELYEVGAARRTGALQGYVPY